MRRIFSLLLIGILFSQDENNNFTFIIYPELVGVGGAPSINIEFPVSEYSIRVGVGMVVMQAELYPNIIYKSTGKTRSKSEIGARLIFIDDGDEMDIGLVSSMNWKKVSKSGYSFRRLGIALGFTINGYPIIMPTIRWGFNF